MFSPGLIRVRHSPGYLYLINVVGAGVSTKGLDIVLRGQVRYEPVLPKLSANLVRQNLCWPNILRLSLRRRHVHHNDSLRGFPTVSYKTWARVYKP